MIGQTYASRAATEGDVTSWVGEGDARRTVETKSSLVNVSGGSGQGLELSRDTGEGEVVADDLVYRVENKVELTRSTSLSWGW